MFELVGLIIAVYTLARLAQIPLEMMAREGFPKLLSSQARISFVSGISAAGIAIIVLLTLVLLVSG